MANFPIVVEERSSYDKSDMIDFTLRTRTILIFGMLQVVILTLVLVFFLRSGD